MGPNRRAQERERAATRAAGEVSHANFVRRSFHDDDRSHACRERPPE
jgi:hypothetical protein